MSPKFIDEGAEIVAAEQDFETEWNGFRLRGSIDRIDRLPEGLIAIDYKLGTKAPAGVKNEKGQANVDIQLPLYILSAIPSLPVSGGDPGLEGRYFSVKTRKVLKKVDVSHKDALDQFASRVKTMLEAGDFSVSPDRRAPIPEACQWCEFDSVCRYGNRIKRKGGAPEADESN